MKIINKDFIN